MQISDSEFPVVVQAYDTADLQEIFIAEQIVSDQAALDSFTTRYAGRLIKVRPLTSSETEQQHVVTARPRKSSGATIFLVILFILIILIAIGFATGWIQENFNIHL